MNQRGKIRQYIRGVGYPASKYHVASEAVASAPRCGLYAPLT